MYTDRINTAQLLLTEQKIRCSKRCTHPHTYKIRTHTYTCKHTHAYTYTYTHRHTTHHMIGKDNDGMLGSRACVCFVCVLCVCFVFALCIWHAVGYTGGYSPTACSPAESSHLSAVLACACA